MYPTLSFPLDFSPLRAAHTPTNPYFQSGGEKYEEICRVSYFGRSLRRCFALSRHRSSQGEEDKLRKNANKIENNYIVVLDDSVVGEKGLFSIAPYIASELAATHRGKLKHVYQHALNGFAVEMSAEDAERLSQDFRVKFVEEDGSRHG